jgi:PAS domain S-box-containing protein
MDFLRNFFDTQQFAPHGQCLLWQSDFLILYTVADLAIAAAYFSIPLALGYFALHRRDLAFRWVFVLFCVFILACGTTHLFDVWTLWNPDYGIAGLVKAVTAIASVATAVALWDLMPEALALPGPAQLRALNERLQSEIAEHRKARDEMQHMAADLERRVTERTAELQRRTAELGREVARRSAMEVSLIESREQFRRLFMGNPLPMWIYDEVSGRFLEVNNAAIARYGYAREAFLAMTQADILVEDRDDAGRAAAMPPANPGILRRGRRAAHRLRDGSIVAVELFDDAILLHEREARLVVAVSLTQLSALDVPSGGLQPA